MGYLFVYLSEAMLFALYIFACLTLMRPRFSKGIRVLVYGAALLCSCGVFIALAASGSRMAALTLLPLIAYLPFSICVYALSEGGIFEAASACSAAALLVIMLKTIGKMFTLLYGLVYNEISGVLYDTVTFVITLVLAAATGFVVFRYRRPFMLCAGSGLKNNLFILIPVITMLLMVFINFNRSSSIAMVLLTLVAIMSFFAITTRLLVYYAKISEAAENEKRLIMSLTLQRRNFERISQSVDAGRIYRHDMRHHLKILAGMARQNNSSEILEYIGKLNESSELCAPEMFCKNPAVNAVLAEYISRAEKLGFRAEYKISIPEELPFELPDVCIILANALENALNACEKCPEGKRYIKLLADFSDDSKLKISVKNPCPEAVRLDAEGLPVVEKRSDGHGIGLHGVKKTVEKYNGFICCAYENEEFLFCAEIFREPTAVPANNKKTEKGHRHSKALPTVLTALVCAAGLLNFSPTVAKALSETLSIDLRTLTYGWGDNSLKIIYPEFAGDNSDKLNQAVRDFVSEAQNIFMQYALQKYEGYVAEEAGYRVYSNDRNFLSARFYATVNVGGSVDFSRCVNIDKKSGEVIALSDLFDQNYDYIGEISAEVLRQMEFRAEYMKASYYLPGGIWSDEECFKEISPEQDFYINAYGQLVIVFEEYTVAPGSEGSPEFVMPDNIFLYETHRE